MPKPSSHRRWVVNVLRQTMESSLINQCTKVDMRGDVLLPGVHKWVFVHAVMRVASECATPTVTCVQWLSFVAIVDGEDEATPDEPGYSLDPTYCVKIDLSPPAITKAVPGDLVPIQVGGDLCRTRFSEKFVQTALLHANVDFV